MARGNPGEKIIACMQTATRHRPNNQDYLKTTGIDSPPESMRVASPNTVEWGQGDYGGEAVVEHYFIFRERVGYVWRSGMRSRRMQTI